MKNNNLNIDINNGENIAECEFKHIHHDLIETVRENMAEEDILVDLAELFKVLGDQTRIKIIFIVIKGGNKELQKNLEKSHHLMGYINIRMLDVLQNRRKN